MCFAGPLPGEGEALASARPAELLAFVKAGMITHFSFFSQLFPSMAPWREWCLVSPFETVCRLNRRQLISASAELIINLLSAQIRSGFSCCISQNRGLTVPFSSVVFKFPSAIEAIIAFVSCTCQALFPWVIFFYFRKEKSVTVVFTGATRLTKPFQRLPPAFRYVHTLSTKVGISPLFCQNGWRVPCLERVRGLLIDFWASPQQLSTRVLTVRVVKLGLFKVCTVREQAEVGARAQYMLVTLRNGDKFVPTDRGQIWTKTTEKSVVLYDSCAYIQPRVQPSRVSLV